MHSSLKLVKTKPKLWVGPIPICERFPYLSERWSAIQPPVVSDRLWPGRAIKQSLSFDC